MDELYKRGTKLIVELNSKEIIEGTYYSSTEDSLTLENVCKYPSRDEYNYHLKLYLQEIISIKPIQDVNTSSETVKETDENSSVFVEYESIKKLAHTYTLISIVDNTYYDVVNDINSHEIISVTAVGNSFGRSSKISILAIGTKAKIYVFDFKSHAERILDLGLREILESDDILKVVHNSKILSDCLYHSYKVMLKHVFDTQVADLMISKMDKKEVTRMRSFSDCVCSHLNLPSNIFNTEEPTAMRLIKRPLIKEIIINAALEVSYLYVLRKFLERQIFKNFYGNVNKYMACMRDSGPTEAIQLLDNKMLEMFNDSLTIS